ncbi:MAG: hypothetical protein ABI639_07755 [Thermoanaerobaculia bacterium]
MNLPPPESRRSPPPAPPVRPLPPTSRTVRWLAAALGAGLGLGCAEIAVRLVAPQASYATERFYAADPALGWKLASDLDVEFTNRADFRVRVRTDPRGLRVGTPESGAESDAGRPAVLAVGDSFTFGWGVEEDDTFVARAASAAGAQAWNAGVPLYDVCQEADRASALLDELAPRVVVLAIFLGNDESDALTDRHAFDVRSGAIVARGPVSAGARLRRFLWQPLLDRSHLLRLLRNSAPIAWLQHAVLGSTSFSRWVAEQRLTVFRVPATAGILEGDRRLLTCARRLQERVAAKGSALVALLVPDQLEVQPERLAETARELRVPLDAVDAAAPRRRIAPPLVALGIPVVDPLADLVVAEASGPLYFRQDPHMTARGHAVLARALAPVLEKFLGTPSKPEAAVRVLP